MHAAIHPVDPPGHRTVTGRAGFRAREVAGQDARREDRARLAQELIGHVLVARAEVREREPLDARLDRRAGGFDGRRVGPRDRLRMKLVEIARLVDQEIDAAGELRQRRTGPRVAAEDDRAAAMRRTDHLLASDRAAPDLDRSFVEELPQERPGSDPHRLGALEVDIAPPLVLLHSVGEAHPDVLHPGGDDFEAVGGHHRAVVHLLDVDRVVDPPGEPREHLEVLPRAERSVEAQRLRPAEQPHRSQEAGQTQDVVQMEVGEEDPVDAEAGAASLKLPLRSLPAVEEDRLALDADGVGRDVPRRGGVGAARAEKGRLHDDPMVLENRESRIGNRDSV